jgi:hypothetical protein
MTIAITLRDASVQDIQLELIRRTKFNTFDGERVCALLSRHRGLWRAVLFDRLGVPDYTHPGRLLMGGLIKLRDLEDDIWNADTLFVLTGDSAQARELAMVFEQEDIGAMPSIHDDLVETDRALGTGRQTYGLLSVWWD